MKKIILIILLCCAGLVVAFLVLVGLSTWLQHQAAAPLSKSPEHGVEFLVEADFSQTPGDTNSLASLQKALFARFSGMGTKAFIQLLSPSKLRIDLSIISNDEAEFISNAIVRRGFLEFRMVQDKSDEIIKNHEPIPPGYEVLQSLVTMPGRTPERLVVKKTAGNGLAGNLVQSALIARDNLGGLLIEFTFNKDAASEFARVTTEYAPDQTTSQLHRIAIIVDGDLYSAPMITSPIVSGDCAISGKFTDEEARRLVQVLGHPLPVQVKILEMKSF